MVMAQFQLACYFPVPSKDSNKGLSSHHKIIIIIETKNLKYQGEKSLGAPHGVSIIVHDSFTVACTHNLEAAALILKMKDAKNEIIKR